MKINPGLGQVCPGRLGPGSTLRVSRVWPGQFPACFLLRPGPATVPGRPAGPSFKTLNTKLALGFATCDPSQTNSIFLQLQNNATSNLVLMLSFVFPFTSMMVLKMFLNTFFSMCIKSRL